MNNGAFCEVPAQPPQPPPGLVSQVECKCLEMTHGPSSILGFSLQEQGETLGLEGMVICQEEFRFHFQECVLHPLGMQGIQPIPPQIMEVSKL